jgi:hypothetical protein
MPYTDPVLQALVAKLPKNEDGNALTPGIKNAGIAGRLFSRPRRNYSNRQDTPIRGELLP